MHQADTSTTASVSVGDTIAGHRVRSFLGRGGMGQVFAADHPRLGRCALKVAPLDSPLGEGATDVRREARLMGGLQHRRVSRPLGSGLAVTASGATVSWLSMRQVPGVDLTRAGRLTTGEVLDVARWIADALDAVHAAGIVHCDVKAANVIVGRNHLGRVADAVLVDFGIARHWQDRPRTMDPSFVGTLTTAPPEALRGHPCGPYSDQYGLACTVYALLAGFPPFPDDGTLQSALTARFDCAPLALGSLDAALGGFDEVLRRALAVEPADRYPDCASFAAALRARAAARAATRLWVSPAPASVVGPANLQLPATLVPR